MGLAGLVLTSWFCGQVRLGLGTVGAFPVLLDSLFLEEPALPDLPGVTPGRRSLILPEVTPGALLNGGGGGGGGGGGTGIGGGLQVFLRLEALLCAPEGEDLRGAFLSVPILGSGLNRSTSG